MLANKIHPTGIKKKFWSIASGPPRFRSAEVQVCHGSGPPPFRAAAVQVRRGSGSDSGFPKTVKNHVGQIFSTKLKPKDYQRQKTKDMLQKKCLVSIFSRVHAVGWLVADCSEHATYGNRPYLDRD